MLRYSKLQKRRVAAFILVLLLAVLTPLPLLRNFHSPAAFLYTGLILAWALTVHRRILYRRIRRPLLYCCGFMILVFVMRICRYDLFREFPRISEYILYFYGVCYTMAALLSFLTALYTGRSDREVSRSVLMALWGTETLLCTAMLTNPLHGLFYTFEPDGIAIKTHGPVYLLMVAWCAAFAVATITMLLVRCRNSFSRSHWFLPAAGFAVGAGLLTWYFLAGGAPQLYGFKLFNLQEAFCLTVVLPFEAIFRIGLIPTNSDYELLFRHSAVKAAILDAAGEAVIASPSYTPESHAGERIRRTEIPGGSVVWFDDISGLLRLRRELTELNEELSAENELIRQEKELQEEQIAYETRNRIYDSISEALRPQSEAMRRILEADGDEDAASFPSRLQFALVMGVYMKRMGNLMLLGDGKSTLPVGELALSIGESFEYLRLGGVACSMEAPSSGEIPTPQMLLCYRLFEHFIEANYPDMHACQISLLPEPGVLLRLALDCPAILGTEDAVPAGQGLTLDTRWEDDTWYVTLRRAYFEGGTGA
ncbi:MAG: hypothetical protein IJ259_02185 [Oscillospiraceae bacterium]|nr:hypothetical protein [Oscillospiraceae bacterium]